MQEDIPSGQAVQENFDSFPSMRIADIPEVETIVIPSGDFWGGVGKPTIAIAAPTVLNAIFAATGKRARQLPIRSKPKEISWRNEFLLTRLICLLQRNLFYVCSGLLVFAAVAQW